MERVDEVDAFVKPIGAVHMARKFVRTLKDDESRLGAKAHEVENCR
jgi:hypothetical protein